RRPRARRREGPASRGDGAGSRSCDATLRSVSPGGVGSHAGAPGPHARGARGGAPMTAAGAPHATVPSAAELADRYRAVRAATEALVAPLSPEDCCAQSMPDASPAKWHLAHTAWFFETFVLEAACAGLAPYEPAFRVLFNSYYQAVGP